MTGFLFKAASPAHVAHLCPDGVTTWRDGDSTLYFNRGSIEPQDRHYSDYGQVWTEFEGVEVGYWREARPTFADLKRKGTETKLQSTLIDPVNLDETIEVTRVLRHDGVCLLPSSVGFEDMGDSIVQSFTVNDSWRGLYELALKIREGDGDNKDVIRFVVDVIATQYAVNLPILNLLEFWDPELKNLQAVLSTSIGMADLLTGELDTVPAEVS